MKGESQMADQLLNILLKGLLGQAFHSGSPRHRRRELIRGDVLCVKNGFSNRYGIWTGKDVILYGKNPQGTKEVHRRSLKDFLHNAESCSVCVFPKNYGRMKKYQLPSPVRSIVMPQQKIWRLLEQAAKAKRYNRYTHEETAKRAEQALGKSGYASSEHFAVWCKTGIAESHELEAMQDFWDKVIVY